MSRKFLVGLTGLVAGLVLASAVLAQVSTNYDLGWHLLSGGGGPRNSSNYQVDDSLGQWAGETSASANHQIQSGFWPGLASAPCTRPLVGMVIEGPGSGYTDTPYSFVAVIDPDDATAPVYYEWSPEPDTGQGTPGATYQWSAGGTYNVNLTVTNCGGAVSDGHSIDISGTGPTEGDTYEADNTCSAASTILTDGTKQTHNFHQAADQDWIKFTAEANKTYVIETSNVGDDHDAVLFLYDTCDAPALGSEENAFGQTVRLEWNTTTAGTYYMMLQQYNPDVFGASTQYDLTVQLDMTSPSTPKNPRSAPANSALVLQWKRSPELDVAGYEICWGTISGTCAGIQDVSGGDTTYYELGPEVGGLSNGTLYYLRIRAYDFSSNRSAWTPEISNIPSEPPDATMPSVAVSQPTAASTYTTTLNATTFSGNAQDLGGNLLRVKVRNVTKNVEGWDYTLTGSSDTFYVENIGLNSGSNTVEVTAYDDAGNQGTTSLTVNRLGQATDGAVIIIAGHNASYGLQTNIYNLTNRAYRIFQGAGYGDDAIYYLAPASQAPYGDGVNKVDATATPANIQSAIETWVAGTGRVGPGKPLYIYMMDHGLVEGYCADGCGTGGKATSNNLNSWLNTMEAATGADTVNVIYEACHSGSFIDRVDDVAASISKSGRVVIASTGRTNNAYASAQGAYFSDAFFSCVVSSGSLKTCYDQAVSAVSLTGNNQTPWLDDNGDGLSNPSDGSIAQNRYIASSFGSFGPEILSVGLQISGGSGTLSAQVERGAEAIDIVWATVYPPSFQEPVTTTLNLGAPVVLLQEDPATEGAYSATYTNGFTEEGNYRVVFYAQDRAGIYAPPKLATTENRVYLPLVLRQ